RLDHDLHPAGIADLARRRRPRRRHLLHRAGCSPGSPHAAAHPVWLGLSPEAVLLPADIVVTVPQAVCTQLLFRDDGLPMWERQAPN
ncbi:MAG: hypothetical protein ACK559_28780, partial [bacterium]